MDPTSVFVRQDLAELSYFAGDLNAAERELRSLSETFAGYKGASRILAKVEAVRGDTDAQVLNILDSLPAGSDERNELAGVYLKKGPKAVFSQQYMARKCGPDKDESPLTCAQIALAMGENATAMRHLRKASERRQFLLPFITVDPIWSDLRGSSEFARIQREIGIPSRRGALVLN